MPLEWLVASKRLDFMKKNENNEITIFLHLCIFVGFLNCCCFLWSNIRKQFQNFNKTAVFSNQCPSGTNTIIGALLYRGIPSDLRSRLEQSHHLPVALIPGDYKQPQEFSTGVLTFSSTETVHVIAISYHFLRILPKLVIFNET